MRIVHSVCVTPGGCGLYETANDLIEAEIKLGADSRVVDPVIPHPQDAVNIDNCDVIVDHSGLTKEMWDSGKPVIHVRHGRPHSTFLLEEQGGKKVYSFLRNSRTKYARIVTFWKSHVPYLELLFDRQDIAVITAPVNLDRWCVEGPRHDFGEKKNFNIVCADIFRVDEDPFHVITACGLLPEGYKVHLAGLKGGLTKAQNALVLSLGDRRGSMFNWITGLASLYRAADLVICPHKIATRALREAMACGTPVLADIGNEWAAHTADAHDADEFANEILKLRLVGVGSGWNARCDAERDFNPRDTATEFLRVVESVMESHVPACPSM